MNVDDERPGFVNQQRVEDGYNIKVGMQVNCDKEAFELYNDYAIHNGFSVRRGTFRRLKGDIIRARTFLCSKAGLRENPDPLEEKKVDRLDTRTDCKARVVFTVTDGVWEITDLNLEHNHELASKEERQFLRSGRKMQPAQAGVIDSMVDAGIRPTQTYDYMANEHGGADKVGFTRRDCHNYLYSKKKILIKAGDGQSVLNHFKTRQVEDPMFFSSVQVNQKNRMTNFFWRDGRSRLDYDCFGDVIMFDTTYRTNKYNMVCAPFVGMNHHWSNVLFGCAFLLDETTESFIWLFETFLESMGEKQPKIIFTDQCQAMSNAIAIVFPESRHRLCLWHISTKAAQKLGNHYADPDVKSLLNKCFFSCDSVTEFEETWSRLIQKPSLAENKWLKSLYEIKEKWCATFTSDIFSAKAQSTQRSESTNNVFHKISTKTLTLTEFVCHYENQSKKMRGNEQLEDFRCKQGKPKLDVNSLILKHAVEVYTLKMFTRFKKEYLNSLGVVMHVVDRNDSTITFQLIESGHKRGHLVNFNILDSTIMCGCKLFEMVGILCRHCLRVLDLQYVTHIPAQYILRRWTKEPKKGSEFYEICKSPSKNAKSSQSMRLSKLLHLAYRIMHRSSDSVEGTEVAEKYLAQTVEQLNQLDEQLSSKVADVSNVGEEEGDPNEAPVLDPPCVRQKGLTNARIKANLEKKQKKKSKGQPTLPPPHPHPNISGQSNLAPTFVSPHGSFQKTHPHSNIYGEHNQALNFISPHGSSQAPQSLTYFTSSALPANTSIFNQTSSISSSFDNQPTSFTSLLQSSDHMLHLSQTSTSSGAGQLYPWFGTPPPK